MNVPKLTKPQDRVLSSMQDGEWHGFSESYSPVVTLLALGLIERELKKYGGYKFRITQEGSTLVKGKTE